MSGEPPSSRRTRTYLSNRSQTGGNTEGTRYEVALAVVREVEVVDLDAAVGEVASMVGEVALVVDEAASAVGEVALMVVA